MRGLGSVAAARLEGTGETRPGGLCETGSAALDGGADKLGRMLRLQSLGGGATSIE